MEQFKSGADFRLVSLIDPSCKDLPDYSGYIVPIDKVSAFIQGVDKLAKSLGVVSFSSLSLSELLEVTEQANEYHKKQRNAFKAVR